MKKKLLILGLICFVSCTSHHTKIERLEKENDSLKNKLSINANNDLKNYVFYLLYKDGKAIGTLSKYNEVLPEYDLILNNKDRTDTLINNGTSSDIFFKVENSIFSDSLTKINLKFRESGIEFFGKKMPLSSKK
ncbi:MAG TPA: hypothetical protein VKY33_07835 [Flavobacterium sp.]|nr:hypothetical protein [Flavobacterium sp.]